MKQNKKYTTGYERHLNRQGWIFILTAMSIFMLFTVYPIIKSFILTFYSIKGGKSNFIGLINYVRLLKDALFWESLGNTFLFLVIQVPIMLILALILASVLNSSDLKFRGFFRTAIFLPCVTSLVGYSVLFRMMFANDGIINTMLLDWHIISIPIEWLNQAIGARTVIILALIWRWTGYNMMFYLAAIQNLPREVFEAAKVDGASVIQILFKITIPQLKPIILFTTIMSTIGTLQLFDEPMNLTLGGPGTATLTISQYIYNQSFLWKPNFAYSATISYVIVLIIAILSIIQFRVAGDKDEK